MTKLGWSSCGAPQLAQGLLTGMAFAWSSICGRVSSAREDALERTRNFLDSNLK